MVVYFADADIYANLTASFLKGIDSECPQLELVFVVNDLDETTLYPINLLRNIALEGIRTSHFLLPSWA